MQLSLENLAPKEHDPNTIQEIDLLSGSVRFSGGAEESLNVEDIWPPFSFLKGMGFSKIKLHSTDRTSIENWSERIFGYQQDFITDPDYIDFDECIWDEIGVEDEKKIIECVLQKSRTMTVAQMPVYAVPPMEAPLAVDQVAVDSFVAEIEKQQQEDILLRMQSILKEFRNDVKNLDNEVWVKLLGDIIAVSLECGSLKKAINFAQEHREALKNLWDDSERALRILGAYEVKNSEIREWARIFESFPLEKLVRFLKSNLSSQAGPQLIKLMNYRAQAESEHLIEICSIQSPDLQKILLQWLTPFWRPKHYSLIMGSLKNSLKRRDDLELINYWIQALMSSYRSQAFEDLKSFFKPKNIVSKLVKKSSERIEPEQQRYILKALSEHPSAETVRFLKEIKPFVKGGVADEVEKVIHSYQGGKAS